MSTRLRAYPGYRDSGVEWLGRVPAHWDVLRAKALFREVDDRSADGSEELLSVSHKTGVTPRRQKNISMFQAESYAGYKLCRPGDLVVNTMWAWMAALGVSQHEGIVSNAYGVYRPNQASEVDGRYFDHLLRTEAYRAEYVRRSTGITTSRLRLYPTKLLSMPLLCPPLDEQRRIADYLGAHMAALRSAAAKKQRLIALLLERKQAIVERLLGGVACAAATVATHPELGEVPGHWRIARLKDWSLVNARTLPEDTPADFEFDYFDISTVGTGVLVGQPQAMRFADAPSRARRLLAPNDVLISTVRTYLKAVYFFQGWPKDAVASTGFAVLTPRDGVVPELLAYALLAPRFIDRVVGRSNGIAYPAISETRLAALHLALPLDVSEQAAILQRIRAETKLVDEALAKERKLLDLLREHRDAFVAAVVSGNLDVRHGAVPHGAMEPAGDPRASGAEMEEELEAAD